MAFETPLRLISTDATNDPDRDWMDLCVYRDVNVIHFSICASSFTSGEVVWVQGVRGGVFIKLDYRPRNRSAYSLCFRCTMSQWVMACEKVNEAVLRWNTIYCPDKDKVNWKEDGF
jgi:hypothetical protein